LGQHGRATLKKKNENPFEWFLVPAAKSDTICESSLRAKPAVQGVAGELKQAAFSPRDATQRRAFVLGQSRFGFSFVRNNKRQDMAARINPSLAEPCGILLWPWRGHVEQQQ
jgi:hypothetical protein